MFEQTASKEKAGWKLLGELHRLAEQLGGAPGFCEEDATPPHFPFGPVESVQVLSEFLRAYYSEVLVACELPAIVRAYEHAHRAESRELIAADVRVSRELTLSSFACASRHLGAAQLQRLRPLRDQRLVQRYLQAVEKGEAHGWHTIVYGLILSVYSLPLRQGLISFGRQTVHRLIRSAQFSLHLPDKECQLLLEKICSPLPQAVETILRNHPRPTSPAG